MGHKYDIPHDAGSKEYFQVYYQLRKGNASYAYKPPYVKPEIDTSGIIKETDHYVLYVDKVWSKHRDRYMIVKYNRKAKCYSLVMFASDKCRTIYLSGDKCNIEIVK